MAKETGAMKARARVLDSTPLYDAVATQDTVTQLRAAIRKLLAALDQVASPLAEDVRSVLVRDDDYDTVGKPPCDWDDKAARDALVDALVRDALAALGAIDGEALPASAAAAADLLALVAGQDVEEGDDGVFRIVHKVAKDRVISTVDPEARHGHKSRNRRFDGYKAHLSIDPDSELIDEVAVTPANAPDRDAVDELVGTLADEEDKPEILGDSAYADGATRAALGEAGFEVVAKVPPVRNATGLFTKDRFDVDLETNTVTCPAGQRVAINPTRDGAGRASFKVHCTHCPLRRACTKSRSGRTISIGRYEDLLQTARSEQSTPEWQARYRADRPKVERKISHFVRRPWGGRHARVRGKRRIATDVDTRAGAINWADWPCLDSIMTVPDGAWRGSEKAFEGHTRSRSTPSFPAVWPRRALHTRTPHLPTIAVPCPRRAPVPHLVLRGASGGPYFRGVLGLGRCTLPSSARIQPGLWATSHGWPSGSMKIPE